MMPSLKSNPVIVSLFTVIVIVAIFLAGFVFGYWTHGQLAFKNENKIIRDDEVASKKNDDEESKQLNEIYSNGEILNNFEEDECAKCFGSVPIPLEWSVILHPGSNGQESESY